MTSYKKQNLIYEWIDFSNFFSKFEPKYGRKFWKNLGILFKIWPEVWPISIWMGHFFSGKIAICMGLLLNFAVAPLYQNQTWVPPGDVVGVSLILFELDIYTSFSPYGYYNNFRQTNKQTNKHKQTNTPTSKQTKNKTKQKQKQNKKTTNPFCAKKRSHLRVLLLNPFA